MRPTPLHAKVHFPLIVAALMISALSFVRWRFAGTLGLDMVFPPSPAAEIIGILFAAAVVSAGYGYYNAVLRGKELGLSFDDTVHLAKMLGIISFIGLPLLSNDIYIYLSCGQAPLLGNNPYTDVALLPDSIYHRFVPPIWADGPYCKYGPAALSIAQFAALVGGTMPLAGIFAWKVLALAAFLLFCDAIGLLLKRTNSAAGPAGPFILLCPILWVQAAGQGHNDIFAALFLAGSLLAMAHGRWIFSALLLTLGLQVKVYLLPLYLLFLFEWHRREGISLRSTARLGLTVVLAAGFAALLYVPYWDGVGSLTALYGPLVSEEPMNNVAYLIPYGITALIPATAPYASLMSLAIRILFLILIAIVSFWQVRRLLTGRDHAYIVFLRILALVICFAAVRFHAWYFLALLPLFAFGAPPVWLRWGTVVFPLTLMFDIHNFVPRDSAILLILLPPAVIIANLLFFYRLRERLTDAP